MPNQVRSPTTRLDRYALHPVFGPIILAVLMFLVFQAVFSWAAAPMDWIDGSVSAAGAWVQAHMPDGMLRSLLVDGVISGAGSVLVFLPQILILFGFILALEDSGCLPRAAFLLDRVMGGWAYRAAPSFHCCRALPAPSQASWPRARLQIPAIAWSPS